MASTTRGTGPILRALRPEPHRGDQVAAGVVVLATFVLLVDIRFADVWAVGARFAVAAVAAAFVGALAALSPLESDEPRAYQTVLYITTCLLSLLALTELSIVLGADGVGGAGALAWTSLAVALLALVFAVGRNSSYATLVAALAGTGALVSGVEWSFDPSTATPIRWVLLVVLLGELFGVALLRDRRRRHAVMLVDAAGVAGLALGATYLAGHRLGTFQSPAWGWMLVLAAVGFALVAYAGVDREPGPGYLGVAILVLFAVLAGTGGRSLLGWPLLLFVVAAGFLVLGLRPSHPLPPNPEGEEPVEPRAVPLPRRADDGPPVTRRPRGDDEL